MPYATPADVLKRLDARRVGQLVLDNGAMATTGALATDPNLLQALEDAEGVVNAAALRGRRYSVADLNGLAGPAKAVLVRLVCLLSYQYLVERRGGLGGDEAASPGYSWAVGMLEMLANGERVFQLDAALDAGKPVRAVLSKNRTLVSSLGRVFGDLVLREGNPGDPPRHF